MPRNGQGQEDGVKFFYLVLALLLLCLGLALIASEMRPAAGMLTSGRSVLGGDALWIGQLFIFLSFLPLLIFVPRKGQWLVATGWWSGFAFWLVAWLARN